MDGTSDTSRTASELELIEARLSGLRSLVRSSALLRGAAVLVVAALSAAVASFIVDRTFRLSVEWRAIVLGIQAAVLVWFAWKYCVRPLGVRLSAARLASILERRFPHLGDALRSAVDFAPDVRAPGAAGSVGAPPGRAADDVHELRTAMKRRVVEQASRAVEGLRVEESVDTRRVARALGLAAAVAIAVGGLAAVSGATLRTWFHRNILLGASEWPYRTILEVEGFSASSPRRGVPRGDSLVLRVRALQEVPARVRIRIHYPAETRRFNLPLEGTDLFIHEQPEVTEPFEFSVEGGDYRSRRYQVHVLERPEVEACSVTMVHPEYTRWPPRTLTQDIGELAVPAGTRIELRARATKPLAEAWLETEGKRVPLEVSGSDARDITGSFVPGEGGMATLQLADREGVPPDRWLRFLVTPVRDRLPTVAARTQGIGSMIVPRAVLPLRIRATDDYGVTSLGVAWDLVAEGGEPVRGEASFGAVEESPEAALETVWELEPLAIPVDRRLEMRVFAVDNDGFETPKKGFAATQSFLVVTPERLLEEFLRREEEQRRVLERAIDDQRALRDSTYRLVDEAWKKEGPLDEPTVAEMVRMSKKERELARQMGSISQAMQLILDEMRNNRIAERVEIERLAATIIEPLGTLSSTGIPSLAARIGTIREMAKADERTQDGVALAGAMDDVLVVMDRVLQSMKRIEGFTEVINRLNAVMKIHSESAEEAAQSYQKEIQRIFDEIPFEDSPDGDGKPPAGAPGPEGRREGKEKDDA